MADTLLLRFLAFFGFLSVFFGMFSVGLSVGGYGGFTATLTNPLSGLPSLGGTYPNATWYLTTDLWHTIDVSCPSLVVDGRPDAASTIAPFPQEFGSSEEIGGRTWNAGQWAFSSVVQVGNNASRSNNVTVRVKFALVLWKSLGGCMTHDQFFEQTTTLAKNYTGRILLTQNASAVSACGGALCGGSTWLFVEVDVPTGNQTVSMFEPNAGPDDGLGAYVSDPGGTLNVDPVTKAVNVLIIIVLIVLWAITLPFVFFGSLFLLSISGALGPFGPFMLLILTAFFILVFLTIMNWLRGRSGI